MHLRGINKLIKAQMVWHQEYNLFVIEAKKKGRLGKQKPKRLKDSFQHCKDLSKSVAEIQINTNYEDWNTQGTE